ASKQASNYKPNPAFLASFFTALSGCASPDQHIKPEPTGFTHYYNKIKSENPDYHWEFIEGSFK
ncbi:hypothetical protein, partial [Pseudomonas sp. 2(2015)]|uniref:hypothetical protein n=1 Tax=Pseudomonas sp. 2(2015) TaxID=1619950 RepID=UPI0023B9446B